MKIRSELDESLTRVLRKSSKSWERVWWELGEIPARVRWECSENPARVSESPVRVGPESGESPTRVQPKSGESPARVQWESGQSRTLRTFFWFVAWGLNCYIHHSTKLKWRNYFHFWTLWSLPWSQILLLLPVKVTTRRSIWLTLKKLKNLDCQNLSD